jgi:hypothetical protein
MYKHGIIPCSIINMLCLFMVIDHRRLKYICEEPLGVTGG